MIHGFEVLFEVPSNPSERSQIRYWQCQVSRQVEEQGRIVREPLWEGMAVSPALARRSAEAVAEICRALDFGPVRTDAGSLNRRACKKAMRAGMTARVAP